MNAITLPDYYMGRDKTHGSELTPELQANAVETVRRVNLLLESAAAAGVYASIDSITKTIVGSGWRPASVNGKVKNAAKKSTHMTCEACDIRDTGKRALARWVCTADGRAALARIGLWCERPQWTPSWLHVQTRKPKSGNRFYIPSTAAALTAPLPNEGP